MTEEEASVPPHTPQPVDAHHRRSALSGIWLVPIVAAIIAFYLGWQSYAQHGAEITISFQSGDGIAAGQTQVRYKGVSLGTVRSLTVDPKTRLVEVRVRMTRESAEYMTDHARFWMVRPRLASGDISGVETIIAGAYIQCDPGPQGKDGSKEHYQGLETPPTDRYDEPGTTYTLKTERLGPVSTGSAVPARPSISATCWREKYWTMISALVLSPSASIFLSMPPMISS
jgi:paraquat-inducible protein B